jgi:hypothetical protein
MKRPDFGGVLKIVNFFFQMLKVSSVLQEFKFRPIFWGYLTDHRWGAPTALMYKGIDF